MITNRSTEDDGNKYITVKNENIEKVNKFKILVTSKSEVMKEIKSRLASGNAGSYSVQKLAINIKEAEIKNI